MHDAPAVTYPVGRSSFQGLLILSIWLLGAMAVAAWLYTAPSAGRAVLAMGLSLATGCLALVAWWDTPQGALQWQSGEWLLDRGGHARVGQPDVVMDLQGQLLLIWQPDQGTPAWLWLERGRQPAQWDDLRRAVHARARRDRRAPAHELAS